MNTLRERLREALADKEHASWARWQAHLHSKCAETGKMDRSLTIPGAYVASLNHQIITPYAELSEREKESDRKEVDEILPVIDAAVVDFLEHLTDRVVDGYTVDAILDAWHKEMSSG